MKIRIVTEGTAETGLGHIGRCTALWEAFRTLGHEAEFVVSGGEAARRLLQGKRAHFFDWVREPERLTGLLAGVDIVVVDSYRAPLEIYEAAARAAGVRVWIDDYMRLDYPPGIVANGTMLAERMPYRCRKESRYLLGADYIILREEFREVPPKRIAPQIGKVLVTMGGSDVLGLTPGVLDMLARRFPAWEKHVVMGSAAVTRKEAERAADERTTFYENLPAREMRRLMEKCDAAVSAAGQTLNELARCGVPSVVFQVAENQTDNIRNWTEAGFIAGAVTLDGLAPALERLLPVGERERIARIGQSHVDGRGAVRIARAALGAAYARKLSVRKAEEEDLMPLFGLANDPVVRAASFHSEPIPLETHRKWLKRVLENPSVLLLVFRVDGKLAGQVRFDVEEGETVTSIGLAAPFRGYGLGPVLLKRALAVFRAEYPRAPEVVAYIKAENRASRRSFEKAGYRPVGKTGENVFKYTYGKHV